MLKRDETVLVVVDVQGRLAQLMDGKEELLQNLSRMIRGAQILGLPILLTEQYPQGLGGTVPEIAGLLPDVEPISKTAFSCCGESAFNAALTSLNRRQIMLVGIETHICVLQTALDLMDAGYHVQVVADAVSSRTTQNRQIGLGRIAAAGGVITSTESALFELVGVAEDPQFKAISRLVK